MRDGSRRWTTAGNLILTTARGRQAITAADVFF